MSQNEPRPARMRRTPRGRPVTETEQTQATAHLDASPAVATEPQAPDPLLPHHRKMLVEGSGISPDVIAERGYCSVKSKAELGRKGFGESQRIVPTLYIPIWGVNGEVTLHHHRPDHPRIRDRKPAKYEFPFGERMALDVHPRIRERVRDPHVPLFITEGVKKADAGISNGLCIIAVVGTWNFRGTNEYGGLTTLPDWEGIAFKGRDDHGNVVARQVFIVYDSDVMTKPHVHAALQRLSEFLKSRGAKVCYVYLPHGDDGRKVGLDDYLADGHSTDDLLARATPELLRPVGEERAGASAEYEETNDGLFWNKPGANGARLHVCNFTARITAQVTADDGAEQSLQFAIEASHSGRTYQLSVPADQFVAMNWHIRHIGSSAVIFPSQNFPAHARAAIQLLSGEPPRQAIYKHTGWREIRSGDWVYLHAGGAIGCVNDDGIQVALSGPLALFKLPAPPAGPALIRAVRASMGLAELGRNGLTLPVFAAVYRSVLQAADASVYIAGPTGVYKTEMSALAQQHFGEAMNRTHLPGAWSSTGNSLEELSFLAKDTLLVIDDFCPCGSTADVQRLHAQADRVLRAQRNNSGRGRLNRDGSLRAPRPPRGMILSTGEDIPTGQSLRAGMFVLEVAPGDIPEENLSRCQSDAAAGLYAQAMAGFISWLAPQYPSISAGLKAQIQELREKAGHASTHRRTPEIVANLAVGLCLFCQFASHVGALSEQEAEEFYRAGWQALLTHADVQARHVSDSEPTRRFLEMLRGALAAGKAHVANADGDRPANAEAWGWTESAVASGTYTWRGNGDCIGWVDCDDLYLDRSSAYACARRIADATGEGLSLTATTLSKRLKERGVLVAVDSARTTLTVRKTLQGSSRDVLHLRATALVRQESDKADKPDRGVPVLREPHLTDLSGLSEKSGTQRAADERDQSLHSGNKNHLNKVPV